MAHAYLGQLRVSYESSIIELSYEVSFVPLLAMVLFEISLNLFPGTGIASCIKRLTIENLMQIGVYTNTHGMFKIIFALFINLN